MYAYTWDEETGGLILNSSPLLFSKEPRPVYYQELDTLGFDKYWNYDKDDSCPYMWAEANNYFYRGRMVAQTKGGSLFTAPEIIILDYPEPKGEKLKMIDISKMVQKNADILDSLSKETIKKIYNTYLEYEKKLDIFHVSFSGGKDSEVCLDLVQRAIPHESFVVVFGDTGMEFSDTYDSINKAKQRCENTGIKFYTARSHMNPHDSWKMFGPPSSSVRWCCSVHKTTPQLLFLRELLQKDSFTEMAFVGVRRDESVRRSGYDYISYGTKHKGQYSCNPILDWNSAEVYLYIYANNLPINLAYKKGISRAGCLVCPMAASKSDYMNHINYLKDSQSFVDIIKELNCSEKDNSERLKSYLENTGWKARKNGRDLAISPKDYLEELDGHNLVITFKHHNGAWKQWIKTLGKIINNNGEDYMIEYANSVITVKVKAIDNTYSKAIIPSELTKSNIDFQRKFRRIFRKTHYCVACRVCEANCKYGNLKFNDKGELSISDKCIHCGQCLEIDTGCLVYKSLWLSKGTGNMKKKSLDCYATHAPKMEWFSQFIKLGDKFSTEHALGNNQVPAFKRFLRDSGLIENDKDTNLCSMLRSEGLESQNIWALMLVNLSYSPQVGWFITRFGCNETITQKYMSSVLVEEENVSKSAEKSVPNSIKRIAALPLNQVGFGEIVDSTKAEGFVIMRNTWQEPDGRVILYALYKFAEACGEYYQFTLTRLLDTNVDSNGVSPTTIFGLDRETMTTLLKGLSVNYPDYISTSFTHDLDNINLVEDVKAEDVLTLF